MVVNLERVSGKNGQAVIMSAQGDVDEDWLFCFTLQAALEEAEADEEAPSPQVSIDPMLLN